MHQSMRHPKVGRMGLTAYSDTPRWGGWIDWGFWYPKVGRMNWLGILTSQGGEDGLTGDSDTPWWGGWIDWGFWHPTVGRMDWLGILTPQGGEDGWTGDSDTLRWGGWIDWGFWHPTVGRMDWPWGFKQRKTFLSESPPWVKVKCQNPQQSPGPCPL